MVDHWCGYWLLIDLNLTNFNLNNLYEHDVNKFIQILSADSIFVEAIFLFALVVLFKKTKTISMGLLTGTALVML